VPPLDFYLACCGEGASARALRLARALRKVGKVFVDLSQRSLRTQLKGAEKAGAKFCVIVSEDREGKVVWKDMAAREQEEVEDASLESFARRRCGV